MKRLRAAAQKPSLPDLAAGTALFFLFAHFLLRVEPQGLLAFNPTGLLAVNGLSLHHGLHDAGVPAVMPLSSLWFEFLQNHLSTSLRTAAGFTVLSAALVLTYTLARTLFSGLWGIVAAAAVLSLDLLRPTLPEDLLYRVAILLIANILAWRARKYSQRNSWVLGGTVGLSLLVRSPMFLFLPLLACWERLRAGRRGLWPLLAAPLIVLLPWVLMNGIVYEKFQVLESQRANLNLAAGALGWTQTVDGSRFLREAGAPPEGIILWAAGESLRHPIRTVSAVLRRIVFGLTQQPLLVLLAAIALWRFRTDPAVQQTGALAIYFVLVHCLMAVEARYFAHIWPVWTTLAVGAAAQTAGKQSRNWAPAMFPVWICLVPFAAMGAFSLLVVSVFPLRSLTLDEAIAKAPRNPGLRVLRGYRKMGQGAPIAAAKDFRIAWSLNPSAQREVDFAWALLAGGGGARDLIARLNLADSQESPKSLFLQAAHRLARDDPHGAQRLFDRSRDEGLGGCRFPEIRTERHRHIQERTCAKALGEEIGRLLRPWPAGKRIKLFNAFAALTEGGSVLRREAAQAALRSGDSTLARETLARYVPTDPKEKMRLDIARLFILEGKELPESLSLDLKENEAAEEIERAGWYAALGRRENALSLLARLMETPRDGITSQGWLRIALTGWTSGDRGLSLAALARVDNTALSAEELRRAAGLHEDLGDQKKAMLFFDEWVRLRPRDKEAWLSRASHALRAGDKEAARESLARLTGKDLDPGERRRVATLYGILQDHAKAAEVLGELARRSPGDAELWLELAFHGLRLKDATITAGALARIKRLEPEEGTVRRAAELYGELGDNASAMDLLEGLLRRFPRSVDAQIDLADFAMRAQARTKAYAALERAAALPHDSQHQRRMALLYQKWKEYPRAIRLFAPLTRKDSLAAAAYRDMAVCQYLSGKPESALASLRTSIARDPGLLSAYLTLGSILVEKGRPAEALGLYDRALAAGPSAGEQGNLLLIRQNREDLASSLDAAQEPAHPE